MPSTGAQSDYGLEAAITSEEARATIEQAPELLDEARRQLRASS